MDFNDFMQKYAEEIDGQYSEYDDSKAVIIIPLKDNRFQSVVGHKTVLGENKREAIQFSSKVCQFRDDINLKELLT